MFSWGYNKAPAKKWTDLDICIWDFEGNSSAWRKYCWLGRKTSTSTILLYNYLKIQSTRIRPKWHWLYKGIYHIDGQRMLRRACADSLSIRAISPEPLLFAHTIYETRGRCRQRATSLVLFICCASAFTGSKEIVFVAESQGFSLRFACERPQDRSSPGSSPEPFFFLLFSFFFNLVAACFFFFS